MAITKTDFINFVRCPRYVALENIRKDKLTSKMSLEEYKKEEENEKYSEILGTIFEETSSGDVDLTLGDTTNIDAMLPYYNRVEMEASKYCERMFGGKSIYSEKTYNQESFDFVENGIRYLCYVDIYNESNDEINIIEVKSTTSKKYINLEYGKRNDEKYPLFLKKDFYYFLSNPVSDDEKVIESYNKKVQKIYDKYDIGKYMYDLSFQRYIIDRYFKEQNINKKVNYFLAVLNTNYIYDGYKEDGETVYHNIDGEELITLFKLNDVTKNYLSIIDNDRKNLEKYLIDENLSTCKVGEFCGLGKYNACKFSKTCFGHLPSKNKCYDYLAKTSIKDEHGVKYNKYDLVNEGFIKLDDVPETWLNNQNNKIERDCYVNNDIYIDKKKIKDGIDTIKYPIYHLDFESFPCPLPRFKGEKPFTQSCFEFSLHIESEPGVCDKLKDNFVFLADTLEDERENLVKSLVEHIDGKSGTMLAQNVGFENGRIRELAVIFPEYKERLLAIVENSFDLIYLVKTNTELYKSLGYNENDAKKINFYHPDLTGSYSIKKTLPVFSDLSYSNLDIGNGTQALCEYAKYNLKSEEDLKKTKEDLTVYCRQDTWAMVEILNKLREFIDK